MKSWNDFLVISEITLLKDFFFEPKKNTNPQIWKYLSTSNLLDNIKNVELTGDFEDTGEYINPIYNKITVQSTIKIDKKKELARLAAARREALELYIEDLNKNLNSLSNNKDKLEAQLSKSNIALELAYDNLDKTKLSLSSQKEFNIILKSTISNLKKKLVNNYEEKEIFLKNLNPPTLSIENDDCSSNSLWFSW